MFVLLCLIDPEEMKELARKNADRAYQAHVDKVISFSYFFLKLIYNM